MSIARAHWKRQAVRDTGLAMCAVQHGMPRVLTWVHPVFQPRRFPLIPVSLLPVFFPFSWRALLRSWVLFAVKISKKEIARLLKDGKEEKARIKVEQVCVCVSVFGRECT